jgi:hypothetical protein
LGIQIAQKAKQCPQPARRPWGNKRKTKKKKKTEEENNMHYASISLQG